MTDYNPRRYRGYKLEKEGSGLNPYCVKLSPLSSITSQ